MILFKLLVLIFNGFKLPNKLKTLGFQKLAIIIFVKNIT